MRSCGDVRELTSEGVAEGACRESRRKETSSELDWEQAGPNEGCEPSNKGRRAQGEPQRIFERRSWRRGAASTARSLR